MEKGTKSCIAFSLAILAVVNIILIVSSFSYLEYYEYGLKKRSSTGSVDTGEVYSAGRYFIGPDYGFRRFKADVAFVEMNSIAIFTADKLEILLSCNFQYFLRKADVGLMFSVYGMDYAPIIESNALVALKGVAPLYTNWEYIRNRSLVENGLKSAVSDRLSGTCCEEGCEEDDSCTVGCKVRSSCTNEDKGLFVRVTNFQLLKVNIPSSVEDLYLEALIETEQQEKATYLQQEAVVKEVTNSMIEAIHNEAAEIRANATARAGLIGARAQANATAIIEQARTTGLNLIYSRLSISAENYKNSYDYLNSLKGHSKLHLSVDFNQMIVGPYSAP